MDERDSIQEIKERLVKIETLLENMTKTDCLEREVIEEKIKVANKRISDLEDTIRWIWRTVVGSFITGAIAIVFSLLKYK
jgi:tetrahydromethanopterin S-methyltransferase subunit G